MKKLLVTICFVSVLGLSFLMQSVQQEASFTNPRPIEVPISDTL